MNVLEANELRKLREMCDEARNYFARAKHEHNYGASCVKMNEHAIETFMAAVDARLRRLEELAEEKR